MSLLLQDELIIWFIRSQRSLMVSHFLSYNKMSEHCERINHMKSIANYNPPANKVKVVGLVAKSVNLSQKFFYGKIHWFEYVSYLAF